MCIEILCSWKWVLKLYTGPKLNTDGAKSIWRSVFARKFTSLALNIFYCHTVNHFVSTFCLLCCTDFWTPRKLININAFINDKSSKISIKIPKTILLTKLSITTEIGREKDAYLFRLIGDNSTIATLFLAC